ncbi:hypothetical protein [Actinoplanes derwentensis]|uniref:Protein kinase domain-containing protein n=1 Tax=Actinoplanes derwentensis TaxID=113562 RepID=A0A1H2AWS0_9ACTN|nr:hypothetical protein [Actinoplanes derwentensis]GID87275.1 hypothetical protein Ade03nite_61990 [Actinoplanes derwentensis]SDT50364.1 hypothetical protein SAMN04489716_4152 [Actinoplanes derwentensis]
MSQQRVVVPGGTTRIDLAALRLGPAIDKGGQGEVWSLTDRPEEVFKRYFVASVNGSALAGLVAFPASLTPAGQRVLGESAAWPSAVVTDHGNVIGFLMRRVPAPFIATTANAKSQLRELQYLLFDPKPLWGDIEPLDAGDRLELCRRFVTLLSILHSHRIVLGDISMRNILWSPGDPPELFIIDCDSARFETSASVLPQASTPDWNDPHGPGGTSDLDSDRYKLALFVGRVLSKNAYVRPGEIPALLPGLDDAVSDLVHKTFERAAGARGSRPGTDEWARALSGRGSIPLTPPVPRAPVPVLPMADLDTRGERETIQLRPIPGRP